MFSTKEMNKPRTYTDKRGSLTIAEEGIEVPFKIQRVYWIHGVPEGEERGMHSNRVCWEYVVAINGSVDITLEDAEGRRTYHLDSKKKGLLIPPDTWDEIRNFSHEAVLLVLASHSYDEGAYVNSYEEFLKSIGR
jgi:dTDP-4-dehydrorhamnose 3,5-epimerase-like enzyme